MNSTFLICGLKMEETQRDLKLREDMNSEHYLCICHFYEDFKGARDTSLKNIRSGVLNIVSLKTERRDMKRSIPPAPSSLVVDHSHVSLQANLRNELKKHCNSDANSGPHCVFFVSYQVFQIPV